MGYVDDLKLSKNRLIMNILFSFCFLDVLTCNCSGLVEKMLQLFGAKRLPRKTSELENELSRFFYGIIPKDYSVYLNDNGVKSSSTRRLDALDRLGLSREKLEEDGLDATEAELLQILIFRFGARQRVLQRVAQLPFSATQREWRGRWEGSHGSCSQKGLTYRRQEST